MADDCGPGAAVQQMLRIATIRLKEALGNLLLSYSVLVVDSAKAAVL